MKKRLRKLKMLLKFFSVKNVGQLLLIMLFMFLNVMIYFVRIVLKIVLKRKNVLNVKMLLKKTVL